MKPLIEFSEFLEIEKRLEIRVGLIISVEDVEKSNKLIKLTVNFGDLGIKTVVTNIKSLVSVEKLIDKKFAFITNLTPAKMMGIESEAMIVPGTELENGNIAYMDAPVGLQLF